MTATRSDLPFTNCKACGKKIVYAQAPAADGSGRLVTVPLNVIAPVYVIVDVGAEVRAERAPANTFVSHFATCKKVEQVRR
jgi:hypothetical protein